MTRTQKSFGNRIAPWRYVAFLLVLLVSAVAAIAWLNSAGLGLMVAFDVAALTFLMLHLQFLLIGDPESMKMLAKANDANRTLSLVVSGIVVAIGLIAVASQTVGHHPPPLARTLIIPTLVLLWLFSNSVFALHYAHMGYIQRAKGCAGFKFPGTPQPLYGDFLYLAFTFGMSFATSDVEITDERVRRVVSAHCAAAFAVNIGVLSFTITLIAARH